MAVKPSVGIFVHAGDVAPTIISTACSRFEVRQLDSWLSENPDLEELLHTAKRLVERAEIDEQQASP
jgi:hypothetical protein